MVKAFSAHGGVRRGDRGDLASGARDTAGWSAGSVWNRSVQPTLELPTAWTRPLDELRDLRYGEPHQKAAWYRHAAGTASNPPSGASGSSRAMYDPTHAVSGFSRTAILQGRSSPTRTSSTSMRPPGSRSNSRSRRPSSSKPQEPRARVATGDSPADAYVRRATPTAWRIRRHRGIEPPIDVPTAEAIVSTFIEAVIAPAVTTRRARCSRAKRTCASSRPGFDV